MMRVNRVFCYSKDIAKQNGNKLPILELVLTTIILNLVSLSNLVVAGIIIFFILTAAILILFSIIGLSECLIRSLCSCRFEED